MEWKELQKLENIHSFLSQILNNCRILFSKKTRLRRKSPISKLTNLESML